MKRFSVVLMALAVLAPAGVTLAVPIPALAQGIGGTGLGPDQVRDLRVELSDAISAATTARGEAGAARRQAAASRADLARVAQLLGLEAASPEDIVQAAARWVEQDVKNREKLADLTEIVGRIETGEVRDRAEHFVEEARIAFEDGRLQDADRALEQLAFLRQSASVEAGVLWIESVTTRTAFARQLRDFDGATRIGLENRQEARRRARRADFLLTSDLASTEYQSGDERGDNAALARAIDYYSEAASLVDRAESPDDWAETQNNLGNALWTLGARESGTARLEEAVVAYRAALEEQTRERVPLDWAMIQNNLGNALWTLGARESAPARLEEAVEAYRAALLEQTRDRVPLDWAATQTNLGNALAALGARESGTARLEEAVAAYRAALEEYTRERMPLAWAVTQNNLGNALQTLGARESGTARLEEAVAAYRAALEENTRERVPLDWAATRFNLALVHGALFYRTNDAAQLDQALADARSALAVYEAAGAGYYIDRARRVVAAVEEAKRAALP
jgi:tetratricopeptide (TPR) repeat protein